MKRIISVLFFALAVEVFFTPSLFAFWIWTPETNKWVNPKYDIKDTPAEQLEFGKTFYTNGEYHKAISEFNKLVKHYPKSREAAEAQFYVGICLEKQDKPYDAFKSYQKVLEKYPFSERSAEIVEHQYKIGERMMEEGGKKNKFLSVVIGGEYAVVDVFRAVIKNAPYGVYAAQAQYKIGLYLKEKGLFQEARDEFEKVINDYPTSEWVKAAKYQIALSDSKRSPDSPYDQKVTQVASDEFKEFLKTYPDADLSEKAKTEISGLNDKEAENNFLTGKFYEKQKNYKAARVYYETVLNDFKQSPAAMKALEKLRELDLKGLGL